MIPSLRPIYIGDLRYYAHTLVPASDPRPGIPGPKLLEAETMRDLIARSAVHLGEGDLRARFSLWSIDYVHYLMPITMVASLILNRQLPVALDEIELIIDEEAMPAAIRLRNGGAFKLRRDPYVNFAPMIRGHLEPLFGAWAKYSGLSPRVFWVNAANVYEAVISGLDRTPFIPRRATVNAKRLTVDSHWPDGWRNPFQNPVFYRPDHPVNQRWRRVCCVRYLCSHYDYCSNCPHRLSEERASQAVPEECV